MHKFKAGDVVRLNYKSKQKLHTAHFMLTGQEQFLVLDTVGEYHVLLDIPGMGDKAIFANIRFEPDPCSSLPPVLSFETGWNWLVVTDSREREIILFNKRPDKNDAGWFGGGDEFWVFDSDFTAAFSINLTEPGLYKIVEGCKVLKVSDERATYTKLENDDPVIINTGRKWRRAHFASYAELGTIRCYTRGKTSWTSGGFQVETVDNWKKGMEDA